MTKAERKLLQRKEAELYLELQQYRNWFGKDDRLTKMASTAWCASYEILELLDVEVDHNLPAAKEAQALLSEIWKKEAAEKELNNQ